MEKYLIIRFQLLKEIFQYHVDYITYLGPLAYINLLWTKDGYKLLKSNKKFGKKKKEEE